MESFLGGKGAGIGEIFGRFVDVDRNFVLLHSFF